jgi:hypothetical protein
MAKRLLKSGLPMRAGLGLAVAVFGLSLAPAARAQHSGGFWPWRHKKPAAEAAPQAPAEMPASQPAAFSIPVEPLGFDAPSTFYEGLRQSLVSLDFIDEDRLLFTFRAPGLIHRVGAADDEWQARAVVLRLPQGAVETEALWTLYDHERHVWMLRDGHFLLRDRDTLEEGDASLDKKPQLRFPGPLLWLEMDPSQQFLVTDSREPAAVKPGGDEVQRPATAAANASSDQVAGVGQPDIVLRILRRSSGKVMLVSRVRGTVHLPINSDGYLEALRSLGRDWTLNLNYFSGGSRILGKVESACEPAIEFIAQTEALATTCDSDGGREMVALSTEGRRLWEARSEETQVWPMVVLSAGGLRLARETLTVTHAVNAFSPLSFDDVKGQVVEVYDAAGGKLVLKAPASPVLDGGGNVAISPSGKRVAVLDAGAIKVYELAAPPALSPAGRSPATP